MPRSTAQQCRLEASAPGLDPYDAERPSRFARSLTSEGIELNRELAPNDVGFGADRPRCDAGRTERIRRGCLQGGVESDMLILQAEDDIDQLGLDGHPVRASAGVPAVMRWRCGQIGGCTTRENSLAWRRAPGEAADA